ncbi:hypothetical protein [Rhizobium sp. MHM7A]|uniref:hypothetical protein n=1 Tax=Rhizobium sp. MHM7A TaxID=2583233 RepID=UPI001106F1BB|nr:hypothetical protein [Rhizobium sp. MHM7A]TLX15853.1 hypothetical protein FFR93_00635 [Rhizobium sp. MHM7A]
MFIPPQLLAKAEILNANFPRDSHGNPSDDALANTVTWLIETFTIKRSLDLALAIGRKIGEQHCIRAVKEDGSTSFALISEEPHQAGKEAEGNGITIFGRAKITEIAQSLSGESEPRLQVGIAPSELDPSDQDAILVRLATLLPWYRNALKLPTHTIDTQTIVKTCLQLGMPEALVKR